MSNVLELSRILDIEAFNLIDSIPEPSTPYFNGIKILDADAVAGDLQVYYGDEIDLQFWALLQLNMGSDYVPTTIYTLQQGYRYIYEPTKTRFTIYDENMGVVFVNNHVHAITDFSIDFTVHKSHQFEIHYGKGGKSFFRIGTWEKHLHEVSIKEFQHGVQNIVIPDRVRPYLPDDADNPIWNIKYLANLDYYGFFGDNLWNEIDGKFDYPWLPSNPGNNIAGNLMPYEVVSVGGEGFRLLNDVDWSKVMRENNFYVEGLYKLIAGNIGLPAYGTLLKYSENYYSFILALISMGLYPELNTLQVSESVYNNRPVYEPYLIYRILKFIPTGYTKDNDEEFPISVFDLSPKWS